MEARVSDEAFQCHHGVPASTADHIDRMISSCFNATTAFLLLGILESYRLLWIEFQCHHGVPASCLYEETLDVQTLVSMPPRRSCFYDLRRGPDMRGIVSMPPRRSCFPQVILVGTTAFAGFNATTAFLLPVPTDPDAVRGRRFNATTAFLLPGSGSPGAGPGSCFNATTAFLLLESTPGPICFPPGVSMPPRRSCFAGR